MYELTEQGVKNLSTGAYTPESNKNRQWKKYLEWLALGNTPRPIKPNRYNSWVDGAWLEDTVSKQADIDAAQIRLLEVGAGELFFRLCKVLIDAGLINPLAPNMDEIKTAYQEWKVLRNM